MKSEQQYFEEGRTIQTYMDEMSQLKDESFQVYHNFELPNDGLMEQITDADIHFLTITEDWCGDAMMINPVIRKIAEAANIESRVTLRDQDTDLIDRHLTNGGRAIPMVLILNGEGQLIGKWGPRAPEVQAIVDEGRAALPAKDAPDFTEKQKEFYTILTAKYSSDETLWNYVYESFKATLLSLDVK
ncbi:thioredoxin family protein [Gracilibacillus sp. S3-1-1]|uniref:Thioredoxin family protein n=1 Tax=Gracilibacillus pellucidus TaxID=3095368 RepID=A0ACC6M4M6_9BACI|nr:thioredoxin family protein [Gracilibacillus sp. S3-1-1]MDX8045845.1 thioredoxin family protein [Gracilibacillus sp. S3-1-1]